MITSIPKAPTRDGGTVCVPGRNEWLSLLARNRDLFSRLDSSRHFLARVRSQARRFVAENNPPSVDPSAPWVVSGHQPELFHPGVWIKCFAAVGLARRAGGVPLHVATDHDTIKRTAIAVPAGNPEIPYVEFVPFDQWTGEVPFESHHVSDERLFDDFPNRCHQCLSHYSLSPIVSEFWSLCPRDANQSMGTRFAIARHRLEGNWGAKGLQAILGETCQSQASGFWLFTADVLLRLKQFRSIYNEELLAFRRTNKIRSRQHPAPELSIFENAIEAPFWVWSQSEPFRRPLFVRDLGDRLVLMVGTIPFAELPVSRRDPECLAPLLAAIESQWIIRPRALMTTAFLRLAWADLFIHGLGGAKYDQWNDAVIRRFWSIDPPEYVMLTATRLLEIPNLDFQAQAEVCRTIQRRRDLDWNPERYLRDDLLEHPPISEWIEEKITRISDDPASRQSRRDRAVRMKALNENLRSYLAREREAMDRQRHHWETQAWRTRLLGSREFSFVLHSAQSLQSLFLPWLEWS